MAGKPKDRTGTRFGRLVAIRIAEKREYAFGNRYAWLCKCDCGNETSVLSADIQSGHTKSCGCYRDELAVTHGKTKTVEYRVWANMLNRCRDPGSENFANYGARGVSVCARWHDFECFLADMGKRPAPRLSIERRDNDGNYEPGNCRWATRSEQGYNRRMHSNNKSGVTGVFWDTTRDKWVAWIQVAQQTKWVGAFDTITDAAKARAAAEIANNQYPRLEKSDVYTSL
jgi:hypothetical protein